MAENTPNTQVVRKKQLRIRESRNLSAIDNLLVSNISVVKAREFITDRLGETYSLNTLRSRKRELEKKVIEMQKIMTAEIVSKEDVKKHSVYVLRTLEQETVSLMSSLLPPEHSQHKAVQNLKELINSIIRRSSELFAEVDFLAVFRYAINMQQLRIAKMAELEATMGLPMRDQADNLRLLADLVKQGIELYTKMGLKPRFGDPELNMQANLGMDDKETESMKRSKEMRKRVDEIKALPPGEREEKMNEFLRQKFPGIAVEAKFEDVK
jgi:hypothetical protein